MPAVKERRDGFSKLCSPVIKVVRITELGIHELVTIKDTSECRWYEPAVSREWTIKYLSCTHLRAVSRSEDIA